MDVRKRLAAVMKSDDSNDTAASNIQMIVIACVFALVTIGLIVLQPGNAPTAPEIAQIAFDDSAPTASLRPVAPTEPATRSSASMLDPVLDVTVSEAVSHQLRQPIRLTDTDGRHTDLRSLTTAVLTSFGHTVQPGDRFIELLVQALSEKQSNAYIDALLNTAAGRGEFDVPPRLLSAGGRLDTDALLYALVQKVRG